MDDQMSRRQQLNARTVRWQCRQFMDQNLSNLQSPHRARFDTQKKPLSENSSKRLFFSLIFHITQICHSNQIPHSPLKSFLPHRSSPTQPLQGLRVIAYLLHCLIIIISLGNKSSLRIIINTQKIMSLRTKKKSCDLASCGSTEGDSSQEYSQEEICQKTDPLKHKTELCKNYSEKGYCPYGRKCRFAHGAQELVRLQVRHCFRKKPCHGFWKNGFCSYGVRCQFSHRDQRWEMQAALQALQGLHQEEGKGVKSRLINLLDRL